MANGKLHLDRRGGQRSPTSSPDAVGSQRDPWLRVAALVGAATVPLALMGMMLSDVAGAGGVHPGSSDAELLEVFGDFRDRNLTAAALLMMATVATVVFMGPLWARLRVGSEPLAVVAVGGGIASAVLWLGWAAWSLTAAVAADFEDAGTARFLMVSGWETARIGVGPYLAMVGAATVAGYRHQLFARWFNTVGLVFTVLLVFGLSPASPAGLMGVLATLWMLVAALVIAFSAPPTPTHARRSG